MARYDTTNPIALSELDEKYDYLFENRSNKIINMTAMKQINAMTDAERSAVDTRRYTWRTSDRYWKIAERFYGDPRLWFIVAYFNKAPTEFHVSAGQSILIPTSPRFILEKLGI